jgi:uncharacterized membrane protein
MSTHETTHSDSTPTAATPALAWSYWRDIRLVLLGALMLLLIIVAESWLWFLFLLRLVLGFIYVLYVPGYCLQAALFPHRGDLDNIERLGLSLGLSVAVVPVLAIFLSLLPWGLFLWPIVLGQLLFILILSGAALWRRLRLPPTERYAPDPQFQPLSWWQSLRPLERRIYQVMSGIGVFLLLAFIWVFAVPSPEEFMTEFYILGEEGLAESYPRNPMVGEEIDVTMGLVNREQSQETYRIEVWVTWAWAPDDWWTLVEVEGPFTLEPGEQVEQPITWAMPWEVDDAQVFFRLYRQDDTDPYRELVLWMDVAPDPQASDTIEVE